jgi:hypothetical protein
VSKMAILYYSMAIFFLFRKLLGDYLMNTETVEQKNAKIIIKMEKERKKLLDALRFYANEENYHFIPVSKRLNLIGPNTLVDKDCGKIAREIIKKVGK